MAILDFQYLNLLVHIILSNSFGTSQFFIVFLFLLSFLFSLPSCSSCPSWFFKGYDTLSYYNNYQLLLMIKLTLHPPKA
jgi:hypothetical protein